MEIDLNEKLYEAETKAWRALAGYKFIMFGYWASIWVHFNKMRKEPKPNPFKGLVDLAAKEVGSEEIVRQHPHFFKD